MKTKQPKRASRPTRPRYRVEFRRTPDLEPWSWCVVRSGDVLAFSRSILKNEAQRICRALNQHRKG